MPRKRPEEKAETRRSILRAAAKCFARDGFERATLQHIATEAQLTVPTLYNYFESKQALVDALVAELLSETDSLFDVLLPRGLTFPQKLELLQAHQFRWAEERRYAFQFLQSFKPVSAEAEETSRNLHLQRLEAWLAEHAGDRDLRGGKAVAAAIIDAVGSAFFRRWLADGARPGALVRQAPLAADVVLHGLEVEEHAARLVSPDSARRR